MSKNQNHASIMPTKSNIQNVGKADPFCDKTLGEWKADKKRTNKDVLAFSRTAEIDIAERYAQDWIDPVSFEKMRLYGKVKLTEVKLVNKHNSEISFSRSMEPSLKGGIVERAIQ
jgi:hypothetical protein